METLKRYDEIATRYHKEGNREFITGQVIRTVSISEKDAEIMNGDEEAFGYKYVISEENEKH